MAPNVNPLLNVGLGCWTRATVGGVYTRRANRADVPHDAAAKAAGVKLSRALPVASGLLLAVVVLLLSGLAAGLPDLRVALVAASNVTDNGAVAVTVTLSNAGDASSPNTSVALAIDGNPTDPLLEFPSLTAGTSSSQVASFVLSCGHHDLRAQADPSDAVLENREDNNNASDTAAVLPLANFSALLSGDLGALTLTLNASSSHGCAPLAYAWSVSGVGDASGEQIAVRVPSGNLSVNLTVASLADATLASRASRAVAIPNRAPAVQASLPFPAIATGVPTGLEVLASDLDGVVAGFVIDMGDGNTTITPADGSFHEYAQPGTYLITVRAIDNLGASTEVTVPLVVLNRPPLARPDPPFVYADVGRQVKLDASSSTDPEGGPLTFVWEFGDGATASGPSVIHTYAAPGIYTARLNVTDERGASSLVSVRVTVLSPPGGGTDVSGLLTAGLLASVVAAAVVYAVAARRRPEGRALDPPSEDGRRPP